MSVSPVFVLIVFCMFLFAGNVVSVEQDIKSWAKTLPVTPKENSCMIIQGHGTKEGEPAKFKVNVNHIREALVWLKANNKWYGEDIEISEENLQLYTPDADGYVTGFSTVNIGTEKQQEPAEHEEATGLPEGVTDGSGIAGLPGVAITEELFPGQLPPPISVVPGLVDSAKVKDLIKKAATNIGADPQPEQAEATFAMPEQKTKPLSEFDPG